MALHPARAGIIDVPMPSRNPCFFKDTKDTRKRVLC